MKVVYKYEIAPDKRSAEMPLDSKILKVDMQGDALMLWVEHGWVDGNTVRTVRHFEVYGTGQPIPLHTEHVGTFFDGPFVWHVYEIKVAS
jgi:hypothetical protein